MPRRPDNPDPIAVEFGAAIRSLRHQRGLSLESVAREVPQLDPRYLGEIELAYHAPTIPTAVRIAHALDSTLSDLARGISQDGGEGVRRQGQAPRA